MFILVQRSAAYVCMPQQEYIAVNVRATSVLKRSAAQISDNQLQLVPLAQRSYV